jgi:hypothetical protein
MKLKKLILSLIMMLSWSLYAQTKNYDQELCNLLYGKQMKEAQHYYSEYKDSIFHPFTVDSYQLIFNMYTGNPDSVLLQLPVFIGNYYGSIVDDNLLLFLPTFYWDKGEYNSGLKILDIIDAFFNRQQNEEQGNEKSLKEVEKLKKRYKIMNDFPKQEIKISDSTEVIHVPVQTDPLIIFEAKYNQTVLKTIFDTGATYPFFMQKKNVEKAGIRLIEPYSENIVNEKETSSAYGVIDSVRIGSLLIKNMPVFVIEDGYFDNYIHDSIMNSKEKLAALDSIANLMEIIMGLPVIKMLNHIRFDLPDNGMEISFSHIGEDKENSNLYIESDRLYLRIGINGVDFTAFMDTGGNLGNIAMIISNCFYRNHAEQFPSTLSEAKGILTQCGMANGAEHTDSFKPDILNMQLENCIVDFTNETAILTDDSQFSFLSKDGYIGLGLLKKLKKVTFDFNAMRMDCE